MDNSQPKERWQVILATLLARIGKFIKATSIFLLLAALLSGGISLISSAIMKGGMGCELDAIEGEADKMYQSLTDTAWCESAKAQVRLEWNCHEVELQCLNDYIKALTAVLKSGIYPEKVPHSVVLTQDHRSCFSECMDGRRNYSRTVFFEEDYLSPEDPKGSIRAALSVAQSMRSAMNQKLLTYNAKYNLACDFSHDRRHRLEDFQCLSFSKVVTRFFNSNKSIPLTIKGSYLRHPRITETHGVPVVEFTIGKGYHRYSGRLWELEERLTKYYNNTCLDLFAALMVLSIALRLLISAFQGMKAFLNWVKRYSKV